MSRVLVPVWGWGQPEHPCMGTVLVPCGAGVSPSMYGKCPCPSVWGFGQPKHPCAGWVPDPCMVWGWGQLSLLYGKGPGPVWG